MKIPGRIKNFTRDIISGKQNLTLEINGDITELVEKLKDELLSIDIKKFRKSRSLDANGLLWACIGDIAKALNADKWEIYLMMLKRYGVYTYGVFRENHIEHIKKMWRETEVVGEVDVNGQNGVQMLLYFGSSTYDTKEFSTLLDGVISEMKEMGLQVPADKETQRLLEEWGNRKEKSNDKEKTTEN